MIANEQAIKKMNGRKTANGMFIQYTMSVLRSEMKQKLDTVGVSMITFEIISQNKVFA